MRHAPHPPAVRLLLTEDNDLNRLVAQEVLRHFGFRVDFAEDGAQAIAKATHPDARYAAILMDLQMPVLDGYCAARQIRQSATAVPIIALTAHAFLTERQKCLDHGMNECLSKPVLPDQLLAALARWIHPPEGPTAPCGWPPPDLVDRAAAHAKFRGNAYLHGELLRQLLADCHEALPQIHACLQDPDPAAARAGLSLIRRVASHLACTALCSAAQALEHAIRTTPAEVPRTLAGLEAALHQFDAWAAEAGEQAPVGLAQHTEGATLS